MGGRGSKSGFVTGGAPPKPPNVQNHIMSPKEAQDFDALSDYMQSTHGIVLGQSMKNLEYKTVQHVATVVDQLAKDFPQAVDVIRKLQAYGTKGSSYACASYGGTIMLGDWFKDYQKLKRHYAYDQKVGFHPSGNYNPVEGIVAHETGHLLERALIKKAGKDGYWGIMAWNGSEESGRIIKQACKDAKKMSDGKGKKNQDLKSEVSRYGLKNYSECLAECVSDYYSNGSKAKPLSRAVWNLLKGELG